MGVYSAAAGYVRELFTNESLSVKDQLGYSAGIFGNCMGQDSVGTYGDKFERDFVGINHRSMLLKDVVSKGIGFVLPPFIGRWYDTSAKGKRSHIRSALNVAPIPFALFSTLLFVVPSSSAVFNFFWTFVCGLLFTVADTFYDMAMEALGLKLCRAPEDRKNFFSLTSLASSLGSMLPGWLIPIIVGRTDSADEKQMRYFIVALVFCVIGTLTMYLPTFTLRGRVDDCIRQLERQQTENKEERVSWNRETLLAILHNRPFLVMQASRYFEMIRQITYKLLPYLYDDVLGHLGMKAIVDMISGSLAYVGVALVPKLGERLSARSIMIGGYSYTGFFYVIMSLFNLRFDLGRLRKFRWVIGACIGLAGMPNYAQSAAKKIITADSTDYMEWYGYKHFGTPVRSDGLLSAAGNVNTKVIDILSAVLYNGLFGVIGYKEKDLTTGEAAVQSDRTLRGLFLMTTLCGLIGNALAALTFFFDTHTGARKQALLEELKTCRLQRGGGDMQFGDGNDGKNQALK